jgi:putative ABC transport system ATP-binding protein
VEHLLDPDFGREPILRARSLNKVYWLGTAVYAVSNVSLEIRQGEFVVIRGPSGCGKSTLLSLLAGLDRPTSGEVVLDGQSLSGLSENELSAVRRQKIGMVYQSFNLLPNLTALENVALPLHLSGTPAGFAGRHAAYLLDRVGLSGRSRHLPTQLSGGEQQRVAIARALANDPKVLMADEPTANLDSATTRDIRALLTELNRDLGQTCVVVTHDHSLIEDAHRVLSLVDGRIVADEPGGAAR